MNRGGRPRQVCREDCDEEGSRKDTERPTIRLSTQALRLVHRRFGILAPLVCFHVPRYARFTTTCAAFAAITLRLNGDFCCVEEREGASPTGHRLSTGRGSPSWVSRRPEWLSFDNVAGEAHPPAALRGRSCRAYNFGLGVLGRVRERGVQIIPLGMRVR